MHCVEIRELHLFIATQISNQLLVVWGGVEISPNRNPWGTTAIGPSATHHRRFRPAPSEVPTPTKAVRILTAQRHRRARELGVADSPRLARSLPDNHDPSGFEGNSDHQKRGVCDRHARHCVGTRDDGAVLCLVPRALANDAQRLHKRFDPKGNIDARHCQTIRGVRSPQQQQVRARFIDREVRGIPQSGLRILLVRFEYCPSMAPRLIGPSRHRVVRELKRSFDDYRDRPLGRDSTLPTT